MIRSSSLSLGPNELSVKAHGFIFTNNPIFNHGDYRLQFKQGLFSDTSFLLRYRNVPDQFLGPNFERRTGNELIQEERVSSQTLRTEIEHRVNESWTLTLIGPYGPSVFNDAFAERDTKFWTTGSQVGYVVIPAWRCRLATSTNKDWPMAEETSNSMMMSHTDYRPFRLERISR